MRFGPGYRTVVPLPPKDLKVHSGPPVTHGGLHRQHQRKVKNTQSYEFYHFPKNGRMQCGRDAFDDDDDVYYYIRWRLELEGETENTGVCTKERKGVTAAVLMATPCTKSRERRWVLLQIPRCDIDGVGEGK